MTNTPLFQIAFMTSYRWSKNTVHAIFLIHKYTTHLSNNYLNFLPGCGIIDSSYIEFINTINTGKASFSILELQIIFFYFCQHLFKIENAVKSRKLQKSGQRVQQAIDFPVYATMSMLTLGSLRQHTSWFLWERAVITTKLRQ